MGPKILRTYNDALNVIENLISWKVMFLSLPLMIRKLAISCIGEAQFHREPEKNKTKITRIVDEHVSFRQNNALAHSTFSVKMFFSKYNISLLELLPYSSDLTPCYFYLFPEVKSALNGIIYFSPLKMRNKKRHTS